jgi:hypothetical protein
MSASPQHPTPSFTNDASQQPSFTRAYAVDVFLSYAHLDNQENWIKNFHSRLQMRLQELLGTEDVVVWLDEKLGGQDVLTEVLRANVERSALFISVLSPRYVASGSCREELEWFVTIAGRKGGLRVGNRSRLIRVVKIPLDRGEEPPDFKTTLGYEFYEVIPTGFRTFDSERGMPRFLQFLERCEDLAQEAAGILRKMKQLPSTGPHRKTVFLAETTRDLEARRVSIRSELTGRGHTVVPTELLPDSGSELRAAVRTLLAKADISVHLIGRTYGVIPDQESKSFGELQYELALAERGRAGFQHLVWIPSDLQNLEERQQLFLARVHGDPGMSSQSRGDVLKTGFESFKGELLDAAERETKVPLGLEGGAHRKPVYLLCDQPDLRREQLARIKAYLRSRGHQVELPPFQGNPEELRALEEELIGDTEAALIYYGTAKDAWILRKRKNLLKVLSKKVTGRAYVRALYLCTPRDESKGDYLGAPDGRWIDSEVFPPLLVLGDCEDFEPEKLGKFLELIEKEE